MTNIKLIHKSRKYADKIMEEPTENCIREMVLQCWIEAYQAGLDVVLQHTSYKEDMGK